VIVYINGVDAKPTFMTSGRIITHSCLIKGVLVIEKHIKKQIGECTEIDGNGTKNGTQSTPIPSPSSSAPLPHQQDNSSNSDYVSPAPSPEVPRL
jgi:hypothetical protein